MLVRQFNPPGCYWLIRVRMSSIRQTVMRPPSLTGLGNRPVLTPSHHVDLHTGIKGTSGGLDLGFPIICFRRK